MGSAAGKLILVRHGESEGNALRVFTTTPVTLPLTDIGRSQAREAAARIRRRFQPSRVITSPYDRARHTGGIIAAELGLPVLIEEKLHEREMGKLRGEPYDIVWEDPDLDPERHWLWRPLGGESLEEVRARVAPVLDRLAMTYPADELVIVSHGGVMAALWAHVTGSWEGARVVPNAGIILVEHIGGRYTAPAFISD